MRRYDRLRRPAPRTSDLADETEQSIAMPAASAHAVAPDVAQHIGHQLGGGAALDGQTQRLVEPVVGHSIGNVRIHADSQADSLAQALDANAFTTGQDIFFRAGAFAPRSPAGLRLLAHEAAHARQQTALAHAAAPGTALLDDPTGSHERAAQHTGAAMLTALASVAGYATPAPRLTTGALPAAAGAGLFVQRDPVASDTDKKKPAQTTDIIFLSNKEGGVVGQGEAGFSRAMLQDTAVSASELGKLDAVQGMLLRGLQPNLTKLEAAKKTRGADVARLDDIANHSGMFEENHFTSTVASDNLAWAQSNLAQLAKDGDLEQQKFQSYNSWAPQANGFFATLVRLQAQMNMSGYADLTGLVTALTTGLGVGATPDGPAASAAGAVAGRYLDAQTGNDRSTASGAVATGPRPTSPLPIPPVDDTVAYAAAEANQAFSVMNTAYLGMQENFHEQRRDEIFHEGDAARDRLAKINEVKQFIANVGKTVDLAASVVNGAPAAIANVTTTMQRAGASLNAVRNRRAILNGETARWNPTYVTVNEKGNLIVRNMQTGMDLDPTIKPGAEGRQVATPGSGVSDDIHLPTSIGGILTTIADFAYSSEIRELNKTLFAIESRCTAEDVAKAFAETTKRVRAYRDALNDYALKANHLQQRLAERRAQYLAFGEQLDNFARNDPSSQKAGDAPTRGDKHNPAGERYANVMVLTSAVREVMALGQAALSSDNVDDAAGIRAWFQQLYNNRTSVDYPRHGFIDKYTPTYIRWPAEEQEPIEALFKQVVAFKQRAASIMQTLAPVDAAADNLIKALHPGGGSGAY